MTAQHVETTVEAIVAMLRRRRVLWELHLGTVSTVTNGATAGVQLDGDSANVAAQSIVGTVPSGTRVVVVYVPPAGYYIVGWTGVPTIPPNEAYGSISITPVANVPTSGAVVYPTLAGTGLVYTYVAVNTSGPGSAVLGFSFNGASPTGVTIWVDRNNTVTTSLNWLVIRRP